MKSRRSTPRWEIRFSSFQKGRRVIHDYLIAAAILSAVAVVDPSINRHELFSCNGFVIVPSRTTATMAMVTSVEGDTLETLTEKLSILSSVNDSDSEDEGQKEERRLDLFRTKLSQSSTDVSNNNDGSDNSTTSVYINNARVDTSTIKNAGRGLFAARHIKEGEVVTCYPGDAIVRTTVDCKGSESANHDIKDRSNWVITWGDHISTDDLDANGIIGDHQVLPDDLLPYIIHAMGDYGILGLPIYSSRDANDDTTYLGHFANDGASNIPFTVEDVGPYIIESCELSNAVNKDVCGCHIVTVATRDIQEGEEIFVVYGPGYWMEANEIKDYDDDDDFELDYHFHDNDDDDDDGDEEEDQRAYYDN